MSTEHHFTFWRTYFIVLVVAALGAILWGGLTLWELFFELPLTALTLIPLYGHAWQRRISPKWLWIGIFVLTCIFVGAVVLIGLSGLLFGEVTEGFSAAFVIWLSLVAPYLFAVYRYVFRSPHLWAQPA